MPQATAAQISTAERIARDTAGKDFVHDPDGAGLSMRRLIDYLIDAFGDAAIARLTWGDAAAAYVDEWERLAGWRGGGDATRADMTLGDATIDEGADDAAGDAIDPDAN